jgi:hypothetical protein
MKTYVRFNSDEMWGSAKKDDTGYIDGYVRGGDDRPCVIVISKGRLAIASLNQLDVIEKD